MTFFNTTLQLIYTLILLSILGPPAMAERKTQSTLNNITDLQWKNRIIVMNEIENTSEILKLLKQSEEQITDRDIIWFLLDENEIISNFQSPLAMELSQNLQTQYQLEENQVILIGKDGGLKSRFSGLKLNDIFGEIDAMPMRQAEMRQN